MRRGCEGGRRNLRSVVVAWLRVVLPLAALAILSTLFLLSRRPEATIPYATVDVEARGRAPQITAPAYAGVTRDGAAISLSADRATPSAAGGLGSAFGLRLDWQAPDGFQVNVLAPEARVEGQAITLIGGVTVQTSTGWKLKAPQIETATDRSGLVASGGVSATAPFGQIEAGSMAIRPAAAAGVAGAATGAQVGTGAKAEDGAGAGAAHAHNLLDFTGGVRLLYRP